MRIFYAVSMSHNKHYVKLIEGKKYGRNRNRNIFCRKNYGFALVFFMDAGYIMATPETMTPENRKEPPKMPNQKRPPKVTDKQKIENLLTFIHGLQDQLDEKTEIIRRQDDIIKRLERLTEEQRELIERQGETIYKRITAEPAPAPMIETARGRRTWQTRRRRP